MSAISLVILGIAVFTALSAPWIAPYKRGQGDIAESLRHPSGSHLLGTDQAGMDVLSQLIYACRYSMAGATLAVAVAAAIGITSGLVAGYFKGWFDAVASWTVSLIMAMPGMIVLLAARSVIGPGLWTSMTIVGVLMSPMFYLMVRSSVHAVREELFVDAARVSGLSDTRIIRRHVLTVVRAPVVIQTAMVAGAAIGIQAGLDFIGLGDLTIVTWGSLLNDGFQLVGTEPLLLLWPSLAVGLVCVAFTLVAVGLRDELSSRSSGQDPDVDAGASPPLPAVVHGGAPVMSEVVLEVSGLRVGYGQADRTIRDVVHGVDFTILRGEVHGLVGESGSGKTQTGFAVLGLLPEGGRVTAGSMRFDGTELVGLPDKDRDALRGVRMGYIPQEPMSNLDPCYSVGSQLIEPMRVRLGLSRAQARANALSLLTRVGIPDPERTMKAYPHELSGGMAQRVLIAGAVSCDPDLLIADEPTTALDVTVQAEVLDLLRDLRQEKGMGVLLVTHDFGVVSDVCDRVSVMQDGRIVETGPVDVIFHEARHTYTQSLLSMILDEAEGTP
ncbi:dipeptide/oligopeptide/nickel ABC transporter permease/ATP-binding protein [Streptomyces sp. NPDC051954]|uniref:dipeptide/oligopeptide/nickel ABC transporter permease/ATP-binding protein n=1 Tax=unclassified Streptomyces TaxID=2593676 RepID=UPI00342734DB